MNILIFGETGQLAKSLRDTQPDNLQVTYLSRTGCDLSDSNQINAALEQHNPDFIINAAAYTAVDQAEAEPELADAINADAPRAMAEWAASHGAKLLHISTDFVFNGQSNTPYKPTDPTSPLGQYGQSKLAGELAIEEAAPEQAMIIRTAWVYSEHGNNFVKTMLRLMQERDELSVVNDQRGTPTYARGLATLVWRIVTQGLFTAGTYHWTDKGEITWYEFASAIQQEAAGMGLLQQKVPIKPITTDEYPTPAARPAYSVLDCSDLSTVTDIEPTPWRDNLVTALHKL
jgi:dTDP-4-dehydrorhamnose reductase